MMKISNEQLGFNKNHAVVIGVVVLAFSFYALPRMGINAKAMFGNDQNKITIIKTDDVRKNVLADMGLSDNPDYDKMREQVALLDRGAIDTKVLGEAIGIGAIPGANDMMLPEMEQNYPFNIVNDNSVIAVSKFKQRVSDIELKYGLVDLMATLNATDSVMIKKSLPVWKQMLEMLSHVPVPESQKDEYRARFGFYFSMYKTAEVYAGVVDESQLPLYLKAMMAFSSKIEDK